MSAYALPGLGFPSAQTDTSRPRKHKRRPLSTEASQSTSDDKIDILKSPTEVCIAVKDATLDPVRLIQSVSIGGNSSPSNSAGGDRRRKRQKNSPRVSTQNSDSSSCSPASTLHLDAIQFELSISFNGRKYVATRTLPRLWQLRNDLVRELSSSKRKKLLNLRRQWNQQASLEQKIEPLDGEVEGAAGELDWEKLIPKVPDCDASEMTGSHGGARRGFTMLQALLRSYCPAVEWWLGHVVELVPPASSPSLTNFLWEPLSTDGGERSGRIQTSSTLDCIHEHDVSDDSADEESEDDSQASASTW